MPTLRARTAVALTVLLLAASLSRPGAAWAAPLPLAPNVDLRRMAGDWYIVGTIPNAFEKGMVEPHEVFTPEGGNRIREDFYVRRGGFDAPRKHFTLHNWVRKGTGNAHWRVQILWPINLPFLLHYVDPDYRYALFGEDNRKLGWIYSRDQVIDDAAYEDLLRRFERAGYDRTQFRRWIQTPDQIGKSGFWSEGVRTAPLVRADPGKP